MKRQELGRLGPPTNLRRGGPHKNASEKRASNPYKATFESGANYTSGSVDQETDRREWDEEHDEADAHSEAQLDDPHGEWMGDDD